MAQAERLSSNGLGYSTTRLLDYSEKRLPDYARR
jgi:hypothetical protein